MAVFHFTGGGWQNGSFGQGGSSNNTQSSRAKEAPHHRPPKGTPRSRIIISLLVTIVVGLVYFYFQIPAINIHNTGFFWFIGILCAVYIVCMLFLTGFDYQNSSAGDTFKHIKTNLKVPFWIIVALIVVAIIGTVIGLVIFRSKSYSKLITVETGDFTEDVTEIRWDQIPMLDAASANNLANRKLGELSDLVSQFSVNESSAQINYNNAPVRTTYLDYGDFFKWINNLDTGIPAYMLTDMRTQEVTVVRLEEGIKYSPSEYFVRDLARHLRFKYPTFMFEDMTFEIDEDGVPYWNCSVIDKTIGLFSGTDVIGAVLCNAITGETQYYSMADIPQWVDRVCYSDLIVEQYNYYGKYHNGFWNSIFGQNDCTETTAGYNYIAIDDDVWLYTGITSVTGDRGNIGFILVNQRTKETKYYSCAGAEEFSAMSSAEGAVQQFSYEATFPLLLNISDQPTYFMALKDSAGLVKMYGIVNVQQYQIVAIGSTVAQCQQNYKDLLIENKILKESEVSDILEQASDEAAVQAETKKINGRIEEIRSASIDGNTIYYFKLTGGDVYYTVNARDYPEAVILNEGDKVTIEYIPEDGAKLLEGTLFTE